jgi:hypothetical protein
MNYTVEEYFEGPAGGTWRTFSVRYKLTETRLLLKIKRVNT